jgi:hypothetical protein
LSGLHSHEACSRTVSAGMRDTGRRLPF